MRSTSQVRYGSVTNTGNVTARVHKKKCSYVLLVMITGNCFSLLSPICSLTDVLLYSHIHEKVQNSRSIGLGNPLLKTRAGFHPGFVDNKDFCLLDDKGQSHADFVGFFYSFGPWITARDSSRLRSTVLLRAISQTPGNQVSILVFDEPSPKSFAQPGDQHRRQASNTGFALRNEWKFSKKYSWSQSEFARKR